MIQLSKHIIKASFNQKLFADSKFVLQKDLMSEQSCKEKTMQHQTRKQNRCFNYQHRNDTFQSQSSSQRQVVSRFMICRQLNLKMNQMEHSGTTVIERVMSPAPPKEEEKNVLKLVKKPGKSGRKSESEEDYFHRPKTSYHWTHIEQKKYVNYIAEHKKIFELPLKDKKAKGIHQKMSKYMQTRTSIQCRSHHQKMLSKFGSLDAIINQFRDLIYQSVLRKLALEEDPQNVRDIQSSGQQKLLQRRGFLPVRVIRERPNQSSNEINRLWYIALLGFWDFVKNSPYSREIYYN